MLGVIMNALKAPKLIPRHVIDLRLKATKESVSEGQECHLPNSLKDSLEMSAAVLDDVSGSPLDLLDFSGEEVDHAVMKRLEDVSVLYLTTRNAMARNAKGTGSVRAVIGNTTHARPRDPVVECG